MNNSHRRLFALIAALVMALVSGAAMAGPPFATDDPEPTNLHHWEIYAFATGECYHGVTSADTGLDLNYGVATDVQASLTLPLHAETGMPVVANDVEVATKFKFLHQSEQALLPSVSLFVRAYLPTGRGSNHVQLLVPLWVGRDFGKWSVFGGGGYRINPGAGNRNFWQHGLAVTRQIRPGFQLGLEYYGQGPSADGERPVHGVNFGTIIHLSGPVSLLASIGQGLARRQTNFYTSLKLDL